MDFTANPIYVLMVLCFMVILACYAAKTKFGKKLGAALLVIIFTAILANLKLIPSASNSIPLYDAIFQYIAPISIFYLLLNINLTSLKKAGVPMIGLFILGSLATTLGVLLSWFILSPELVLGEDAQIIAGMLTGTYTGGSVNFNTVALEYDFQKKGILYAGTIAVDNIITTLWVVISLVIPVFIRKFWKDKIKLKPKPALNDIPDDKKSIDLTSLTWLVFLGIAAFFISQMISKLLPQIPFILILTSIGIGLAQIKFVSRLNGSHNLGMYLVFIFLAVIGAYCELSSVSELKAIGLTLLLFSGLSVLFHGVLLIVFGGLLYRDWDMIAIVSQANIGGGTTAIALAETFDRKELVLPAILVGSLGTAFGSYLGFLVIYVL